MKVTNTFALDFSSIRENIRHPQDAHKYIQENLKLQVEEVVSIALYHAKVVVKVKNSDIFENIFRQFEGRLTLNRCQVKLTTESDIHTVKIHRIPLEIEEADIREAFEEYGVVQSVTNDKWRDLPYPCYNEKKIVVMEIQKPIPKDVSICGKKYFTTYPGQSAMRNPHYQMQQNLANNSTVDLSDPHANMQRSTPSGSDVREIKEMPNTHREKKIKKRRLESDIAGPSGVVNKIKKTTNMPDLSEEYS